MAEMLGRPEFRPGRKIDGHHPANVSYRKVWSADKLIVGQARIEPCKEMLKPNTPSLRERRNLFEGYRTRQGSALQPRSGISKSLLGGVDSIPLDPPQPGFNDGFFLRAPPHQGRIRVELFEVAAYRNSVGNRRTAIEFEYRNHAIRIQGPGLNCSPLRKSTCTVATVRPFSARKCARDAGGVPLRSRKIS